MFDKSDDTIRATRNLEANKDSLEQQFTQSRYTQGNYKLKEHLFGDVNNKYYNQSQSQQKFKNELDIEEDDALKILNAANIFSPQQIHSNRFNKFARYGIIDPYNENFGCKEYLFFSKPDLHIFNVNNTMELYEPLKNVSFFANAVKQYPESLLSLQQTFNYTKSTSYPNNFDVNNKFMCILSNHVASSLDLPAITATESQNNANLYQINTSYRDGSEISDCSYEFSLEFKDNKYLDTYILFKAYDEYERQKYLREIRPTKFSYIDNKVNSEQFSIWKIIVNETNGIMFYAKAVAVYPLNVPRDVISNLELPIRFSIQFKGQFVRDTNPIHLNDLNHLTELSLGKDSSEMTEYIKTHALSLYNNNDAVPNTEWGRYPYIIKNGKRVDGTEKEGDFYRLIWLK